ncbi:DUF368 domain-containing protein [Luteibaculum oceani]|uniref:DUF368 domain-containing protein n=1 Tax=Luteibaculum oceani TaxID=1294296 RepID=A0A5C6UUZ0_9FLAO|nr:DUF368 domain-containing protein [Luteibaculum oceani]TXC77087.1 DUF368 domain-containing protein [Luteibaculum oceani]
MSISLFLKGLAMGMAEVVPGVSGGTIAFITGIYQRLIDAIKSFDPDAFKLLFKGKIKAFWKKVDGNFILTLGSGMIAGIVSGVFTIAWLLENHPLLIWGFFFGLILISCYLVLKQVNSWSIPTFLFLIAGTAIAYYVTVAQPGSENNSYWFIFISGIIAISALLLPGLSGSFILLLMGMYTLILPSAKLALSEQDPESIAIIAVFIGGCTVGLFSFARVMSWAFKSFPNQTLALLTGFLLGSLNKVWPWQHVLSTRVNSKGTEVVSLSKSVLPSTFEALPHNFHYGTDPKMVMVILCMLVGFFMVLGIERLGKNFSK